MQQQPSAAVFPDGEGLAQVQARAVAAVREHDRTAGREHGGDVLWVACTHGDVIKAVVADALGTHLDSFQRITADPASMSVIRYTPLGRSCCTSTTPATTGLGPDAEPPEDAADGESTTCRRRSTRLVGASSDAS